MNASKLVPFAKTLNREASALRNEWPAHLQLGDRCGSRGTVNACLVCPQCCGCKWQGE